MLHWDGERSRPTVTPARCREHRLGERPSIHKAKAFGFGRLWLVTLGRLEYSRQRLFDAGSGWIPLNVNSLGAASKIVKYSR